jgi:hypothetical protein
LAWLLRACTSAVCTAFCLSTSMPASRSLWCCFSAAMRAVLSATYSAQCLHHLSSASEKTPSFGAHNAWSHLHQLQNYYTHNVSTYGCLGECEVGMLQLHQGCYCECKEFW